MPTRSLSHYAPIHLRENIEAQGLSISRPVGVAVGSERVQVRMMAFAIDRSRTIISAMILGRRVTAQDVAWLKREVFANREGHHTHRHSLQSSDIVDGSGCGETVRPNIFP